MFEKDGKQYVVKINDFAEENGVNVRTIQRKLTAEKYKSELDGEFLRTPANGTWLTAKAVEFLQGTFQQQPTGVISNARYEQIIADIEQEKNELQKKYAEKLEQLLEARDEINKLIKEKSELQLEAQKSALLVAENEKQGEELEKAQNNLEYEKTRKITFKEWWKERR